MRPSTRSFIGALLLIAGAVILMGIITAETQYPDRLDYSTANNEVSDLGATRPPDSVITHPSSDIFNVTMLATGAMIVAAGVLSLRAQRRRIAPYVLTAFGASVCLVGIFPGNHAVMHPLVAMAAFVSGGMSCVASARLARGPMRYASVGLGVTTLVALALAGTLTPALGVGGAERWIVYPVVIWLIAYGGYVLGDVHERRAAIHLTEHADEGAHGSSVVGTDVVLGRALMFRPHLRPKLGQREPRRLEG